MIVAKCGLCDSAWFPQIDDLFVGYPSSEETIRDPDFWILIHHYLEIVAGIDWKIELLEKLPYSHFESVLEVGCNVGAFLDYCQISWGASVVGLEPSAYGLAGHEMLGLPIHHELMAEATQIHGCRFDLVLATEVLEHVQSPVDFLREMRNFMADDGVAVITTPRSGSLTPTTASGELYAALSAGAHRFLTSETQLRTMVHEAGFQWCHIEPFGMTQLCVMSSKPVSIGPVPDRRDRMKRYYSLRSSTPSGDRRADLGFEMNHYIACRDSGEVGDADQEQRIEAALQELFGVQLDNLQAVVEQQQGCRDLVSFGRGMPYSLPGYLLWRGHRADLSEHQRTEIWEASALLAAEGLRTDPVNLFVYISVLEHAADSLARRHRGSFGDALRERVSSIPEASHVGFVEPSRASKIRRLVRAAARRVLRT